MWEILFCEGLAEKTRQALSLSVVGASPLSCCLRDLVLEGWHASRWACYNPR